MIQNFKSETISALIVSVPLNFSEKGTGEDSQF